MKILLTGATGFIGTHLAKRLAQEGHDLVVLSRHPETVAKKLNVPVRAFAWDASKDVPPQEAFAGVNAVVHLAGEGIAEKRWTKAQKQKIYETRVLGTRRVAETIAALPERPTIFISASAIGFYGDRGEETLTEGSTAGTDFLANVCKDWERETLPLERHAIRVVSVRIGVVLGLEGGALKKLLPIFKSGLAGPVGSGKQWMSWIHIKDLVSLFVHALKESSVKGVINGTSPEPVTNEEFSKVLGQTLHRPAVLKVPAIALRFSLGELSSLVLGSQKVLPRKTKETGFEWAFPKLGAALADLCSKKL